MRERIDINPLRAFDSDDEGTQGGDGERADDRSSASQGEDAEHFAEVRALLDAAGVAYVIDPTLVRGLDYYTRTIFSFVCDAPRRPVGDRRRRSLRRPDRAARRAGDAGGRLGGRDRADPAGARRGGADGRAATPSSPSPTPEQRQRAMALAAELRHAGLSAEIDLAGRSLKGQLKHADRIGARRVLILEADGSAQLRDMSDAASSAPPIPATLSTR